MKQFRFNLTILLVILTAFSSLQAQVVTSVAHGDWSQPSTWSEGKVPTGAEDIRISHKIRHGSTITIRSAGKLTILTGGKLSVGETLENLGNVFNYDTIIVNTIHGPRGGFDNRGKAINYATFITTGTFENRAGAIFENHSSLQLNGDLENYGTFLCTGFVFMTGDLENHNGGVVTSPSGQTGYFDVCGTASHRKGATVSGVNYLCVRCGGSYVKEAGRIGDFIEECRPFSVSLVGFEAKISQPGIVRLNWQTATETNNEWFVVERAHVAMTEQCTIGKCDSPIDFEEIGRVAGAGNSSSLLSYVFTDAFPKAGVNFYRLRIVDKNNAITYSPTVSVMVDVLNPNMVAYPNPTQDVLHVKLSGTPGSEAVISMYSIDGKLVWKQNNAMIDGVAELEIPTCDFSAGTYILEFKQGVKKETKKVVFQK
jgi:hypothetical protein